MAFDLRGDTTSLAPTRMRRGDIVPVEHWLSPDFDADVADLVCQVRVTPNSTDIAATWDIEPGDRTFDDLTDLEKSDLEGLDDGEGGTFDVDETWSAILITFDASDLEGPYVWDVQHGTNTLFGATLTVDGDVTRTEGS